MRGYCAVVVAVLVVVAGCGSSGETTTRAATTDPPERTVIEPTREQTTEPPREQTSAGIDPPGTYPIPDLPPHRDQLKKLRIKELAIGKGPVAHWGDQVTLAYVGVYWKSGKPFTRHWDDAYHFELTADGFGPGWAEGISGMRVGGRREVWIPQSRLVGDAPAVAYVLHLRGVESRGTR